MNFKNLTYLELLQARQDLNQAMEEYSQRDKIKVFRIVGWGDLEYDFINSDNAQRKLEELIKDEEITWNEEGLKSQVVYIDEANIKFCEDYKEQ